MSASKPQEKMHRSSLPFARDARQGDHIGDAGDMSHLPWDHLSRA